MGIRRHCMQVYSKLIIKLVNEEFELKEITLVAYLTTVQKLIKSFLNT